MLELNTDRLLMDLYLTRNNFIWGAKKDTIKYDYSQLRILNDVFANITQMQFPLKKIFINKDDVYKILEKDASRIINDFFVKSIGNKDILTTSFNNFKNYLDDLSFYHYGYFDLTRKYSINDFVDIILSYYATYGNEIYNIVKKYFEEERIQLPYFSSEHNMQENIGGFFVPITYLSSGYIFSTHERLDSYCMCAIVHELGHAIDAEKFIFPQKKTIKPLNDLLLEVPSTAYEFGFYYYLINNKIDTGAGLVILNDRMHGIKIYGEQLDYLYSKDKLLLQYDGTLLEYDPIVINKEDIVFNDNGELIYDNTLYGNNDYEYDKDGNIVIHRYIKYPFRDSIIYGLGYYTAMHLCKIKDYVSIEEYNKIFNNLITSRKEANLVESIETLGLDLQDYVNGSFIKDRVRNDVLEMKKRFNA